MSTEIQLLREIHRTLGGGSDPGTKFVGSRIGYLREILVLLQNRSSGIPEAPANATTHGRRGSDQTWQPVALASELAALEARVRALEGAR